MYIPFGFKTSLIMKHAIVYLDKHILCITSMSYSYCPSGLTQPTHIGRASNHFLYSVTLEY